MRGLGSRERFFDNLLVYTTTAATTSALYFVTLTEDNLVYAPSLKVRMRKMGMLDHDWVKGLEPNRLGELGLQFFLSQQGGEEPDYILEEWRRWVRLYRAHFRPKEIRMWAKSSCMNRIDEFLESGLLDEFARWWRCRGLPAEEDAIWMFLDWRDYSPKVEVDVGPLPEIKDTSLCAEVDLEPAHIKEEEVLFLGYHPGVEYSTKVVTEISGKVFCGDDWKEGDELALFHGTNVEYEVSWELAYEKGIRRTQRVVTFQDEVDSITFEQLAYNFVGYRYDLDFGKRRIKRVPDFLPPLEM